MHNLPINQTRPSTNRVRDKQFVNLLGTDHTESTDFSVALQKPVRSIRDIRVPKRFIPN